MQSINPCVFLTKGKMETLQYFYVSATDDWYISIYVNSE
jgi:hypothetical protein